jgi:two-component system, OmpR family, sensor histidine kinase BaeS
LLPFSRIFIWKRSLQWKLILINVLVISVVIWLAGVSVKDFACLLVGQYHLVGEDKSRFFDSTMQFYLLRASLLAIVVASVIHYFFIKRILVPLQKLAESTRLMTEGNYPKPLPVLSSDEIGRLTHDFNHLVFTLKKTEESRKQMLSDISHELRTPLTNLKGYLEALSSGILQGDRALYHMLYQESIHLTELVEQLHQLTVWEARKMKPLSFEKVDVQEFMENCLQNFKLELQNKEMKVHVSMTPETVWMDKDGMKQVLNNLLKNAIQYDVGRKLTVTGKSIDKKYIITITNIGQPIPEELQPRIFEPFFRVDPSRQRHTGGSGLGLAIVKEIVEQHGGNVGLHSNENEHSFWFSIQKAESAFDCHEPESRCV